MSLGPQLVGSGSSGDGKQKSHSFGCCWDGLDWTVWTLEKAVVEGDVGCIWALGILEDGDVSEIQKPKRKLLWMVWDDRSERRWTKCKGMGLWLLPLPHWWDGAICMQTERSASLFSRASIFTPVQECRIKAFNLDPQGPWVIWVSQSLIQLSKEPA